jgi:hypothetical protein
MAFVDIHLLVQTVLYFCIFLSGFAISIPIGVNKVNFDMHESVDISVCILSFSRSKGHMSTKEPCPMVYHEHFMELFRFVVFNATFNNISVISWRCGIGTHTYSRGTSTDPMPFTIIFNNK